MIPIKELLELATTKRASDVLIGVNLHYQRGSVACAVKIVPNVIPDLEHLGFPGIVKEFLKQKFGLVLITGPQGNGKSTTIASMIEEINLTRPSHIITIENPIEFTH